MTFGKIEDFCGVAMVGARCETWGRTGELRFLHTETDRHKFTLQQAWVCHQTGAVEWKDVPTVDGELTAEKPK